MKWNPVAIGLHWLVALLIFGQFLLGWIAHELDNSPLKFDLFVLHKSAGITILLLVLLRLGWRLASRRPDLPPDVPDWEHRVAKLSHGLLYVLMIVVPLSGWWVSDTSRIPFRLFWSVRAPDLLEANREMSEVAGEVHEFLVMVLMTIVAVHVLAALRHHFVLHNDTLRRMLPSRRGS